MIKRLQPGYNGGVGSLHSKDDKPKVRFCLGCNFLFGVQARLGPRIMEVGVPKPSDYDLWLECRNCGSLYQKYETKVEPELEPIKEPSIGPKGKLQGIEKKRKPKGRGNNPRLKPTRDYINDEDLKRELKDGAVLVSYSSTDSNTYYVNHKFSPAIHLSGNLLDIIK